MFLFFAKVAKKNVFDNILETENAFKTIKNEMLKKIDTLGLFQRG